MTLCGLCVGLRGRWMWQLLALTTLGACSALPNQPVDQTPPPASTSDGQAGSAGASGSTGPASASGDESRPFFIQGIGASSGAVLGMLIGSIRFGSAGTGAVASLGGGGVPVSPPPAPTAAMPPPPPPPPQVEPGARDTIRLMFGTNRVASDGRGSFRDAFTSTRGDLLLGFVDVSIPEGHAAGEIDRPKWWKLEFSEDPSLHMFIRGLSVVPASQFADLIKQYRGPQSKKPTILFVHGYNVSFADAALRTAQIAEDLRIDSIPAFFSWASRADPEKYTIDENTALQSVPDFKSFLRQFAKNSTDRVFLIAHSMGSRIVTQALSEMIQAEPQVAKRVVQVVLAAPDLDAAVFREQIVPVFFGQQIPITLYASSRDKTLKVSSGIHGCCRAGLGGDGIVVASGLESVDATTIDTSWLGHSYFAETRALLADMNLLLAQGMRAGSRPLLAPKPTKKDPRYYYFVR